MKKRIAIIAILLFFISVSLASAERDVEWVNYRTGVQLHMGESFKVGVFTVKAVDFTDTSVLIQVDGNNETKTVVLTKGASENVNRYLRLTANLIDPQYEVVDKRGIKYKTSWNPIVRLSVYTNGAPKFTFDFMDHASTYEQGAEITLAGNTLKNTGSACAYDVKVTFDPGEFAAETKGMKTNYGKINNGETFTIDNIDITSPRPYNKTNYKITYTVSYYDANDKYYEQNFTATLQVDKRWDAKLYKRHAEYCYLNEIVTVSTTVHNSGFIDLDDVEINDSLPTSGFERLDDIKLNWTESIPEGGTSSIDYQLKPLSPGTYTIPGAVIKFDPGDGVVREIKTSSTKVNVYGSKLDISKSVDKTTVLVGETANISIYVKNIGNVESKVNIKDSLPDTCEIVSGDNDGNVYLKRGESKILKYEIRFNVPGTVTLPSCIANIHDLNSRTGKFETGNSTVHVIEYVPEPSINVNVTRENKTQQRPDETPTPVMTPTPAITPEPEPSAEMSSGKVLAYLAVFGACLYYGARFLLR